MAEISAVSFFTKKRILSRLHRKNFRCLDQVDKSSHGDILPWGLKGTFSFIKGSSFRSESLRLVIPEALSSGGCAGAESHTRRRHCYPDLWRLPRIQPPPSYPGGGRLLPSTSSGQCLWKGPIPGPSCPGAEKDARKIKYIVPKSN